jgi:hypothetical protein
MLNANDGELQIGMSTGIYLVRIEGNEVVSSRVVVY